MADARSVYGVLAESARKWPGHAVLEVLPETAAAYGVDAGTTTYETALDLVDVLADRYAAAGYGRGHRVGLLLENRPEFLWHWLALNRLGAAIVPVESELRDAGLALVLTHSDMCLLVAPASRHAALHKAAPHVRLVRPGDHPPPAPPLPADAVEMCALAYTQGAAKACVLSNDYVLRAGRWLAQLGGLCALRTGHERLLTPLKLADVRTLAFPVMAMLKTGGCLILSGRFDPQTWWRGVRDSKATCVQYAADMPATLLRAAPDRLDTAHHVRFGFGAGVDPDAHAAFEQRFGFPLIEAWSMTETGAGAAMAAHEEPRHTGRRCFGRPAADVEVRVVRADGSEAGHGEPGEMLVRHAGADPRAGFFSQYLKDKQATAAAWAGGWFHTGCMVSRDADGNCFLTEAESIPPP